MSAMPAATVDPPQEPLPVDTPRRRSSRSRTKSPEPIISKAQDPALSAVPEEEDLEDAKEEEEKSVQQTPTDTQMYEKIIDEMDVDEGTAADVNEDELLAEEPDEAMKVDDSVIPAEQTKLPETEIPTEEKPVTDDENRGTKRRSDSPSKGNTPKKRQRLPPPNIEDFVNDEDEPELDETSLQLSWCKSSWLQTF